MAHGSGGHRPSSGGRDPVVHGADGARGVPPAGTPEAARSDRVVVRRPWGGRKRALRRRRSPLRGPVVSVPRIAIDAFTKLPNKAKELTAPLSPAVCECAE